MRKIIHVDMDCFYAAVEIRDNPSLKNKPVAVGGQKRGVITTANYVARRYGVRSAMPSSQAQRLCPQLIFVKPNFEKYRKVSLHLREIFSRYTSKIEPLSLDEAYLDVSDSLAFSGSASLIAREIRKNIFEETQLTASAGIAPNKFLAKVASDWRKPNGQFTIRPEEVLDFVRDLKLSKIPGVGNVTFRKMQLKGFEVCRDMWDLSEVDLLRLYGKWGHRLYGLVRGVDEREVKNSRLRKSLSVERTFFDNIHEEIEFSGQFKKIFEEFKERWEKFSNKNPQSQINGYVLKLRFANFQRVTREKSFQQLPSYEEAYNFSLKIFKEFNQPIRLLGFGVRIRQQEEDSQLEFQFY